MNNASMEQRMIEERFLVRLFKAHDLLAYFVLTFLFTFGGWLTAMLTGIGTLFDSGLWGSCGLRNFNHWGSSGKAGDERTVPAAAELAGACQMDQYL